MGNYPDKYEESRHSKAENKPKVEEVFGPEKVSKFLRQALDSGDTNSDGILSRREFEEYQKSITTPLNRQTAEFVSKHFGALSLLSLDGIFSEGGISSGDASTIRYSDALESSRESYSSTYRDLGGKVGAVTGGLAGLGAQAADFIFTGGAVTFVSTVGHLGVGALVLPLVSKSRIPPLAIASGVVAGMMWGPLYGGVGGYEGGKLAGEKLASNYFQRNHEPHIKAMLQELNQPAHTAHKSNVRHESSFDQSGKESVSKSDGVFEKNRAKPGTDSTRVVLEDSPKVKPETDSSGILFNEVWQDMRSRK